METALKNHLCLAKCTADKMTRHKSHFIMKPCFCIGFIFILFYEWS